MASLQLINQWHQSKVVENLLLWTVENEREPVGLFTTDLLFLPKPNNNER